MTACPRIPVVVVGGFLGAGKTTLLNSLIREAGALRIAALVNDFGALNLDADLVVGVEGTTVALANGCVCCTIHDDLARASMGLLASRPRPNAVLVELSGISEPGPVMSTYLETELRADFELSCVVTVVDPGRWEETVSEAGDLATSQVRSADIIVLSKTDLAGPETVAEVEASLRSLTPGARILHALRGALPIDAVLGRSVDHEAPDNATHPRHQGISAWTWQETRLLSLPRLEATLAGLPSGIYRCKGYVRLEEFPRMRFLLQAVGQRYDISPIERGREQSPGTQLTVIGAEAAMGRQDLTARFEACIGNGDLGGSPIMRLVHKLAPELLGETVA